MPGGNCLIGGTNTASLRTPIAELLVTIAMGESYLYLVNKFLPDCFPLQTR